MDCVQCFTLNTNYSSRSHCCVLNKPKPNYPREKNDVRDALKGSMFDTNNTLKEKGFGMSVNSRDETRGKPFTWGTTTKKQIPYPKNKYHCWVSVAKLILLDAHLQIIFDMTILDPCSWLELIGHECRACRRVRCKLERVV